MRGGNEGSRNSRRGRTNARRIGRSHSLCGRTANLGNTTTSRCPPWCNCGVSIKVDNRKYLQDHIKQLRKELMSENVKI
jgi:hypothetical protein